MSTYVWNETRIGWVFFFILSFFRLSGCWWWFDYVIFLAWLSAHFLLHRSYVCRPSGLQMQQIGYRNSNKMRRRWLISMNYRNASRVSCSMNGTFANWFKAEASVFVCFDRSCHEIRFDPFQHWITWFNVIFSYFSIVQLNIFEMYYKTFVTFHRRNVDHANRYKCILTHLHSNPRRSQAIKRVFVRFRIKGNSFVGYQTSNSKCKHLSTLEVGLKSPNTKVKYRQKCQINAWIEFHLHFNVRLLSDAYKS